MDVPVSRHRFGRGHNRFHVVAESGSDGGKRLSPPGIEYRASSTAGDQCRRHPAYASAIGELKQEGELGRKCRCRPSPYLNNIIEQDHRYVKKRITASQWFRSVDGALNTIAGYEAMNIIRKGQIRWLPKGDVVGQKNFVDRIFAAAA